MYEEFYSVVNRLNQNMFDAAKQLVEINAHAYEKLLKNQIKVAGLYMEGGAKQVELVHDFKDPAGYMASQGGLAKQYMETVMTVSKENLDVMAEARNELTEWFKKGAAEAAKVAPVAGAKKAA
jgi:Phasin protein